MTVLGRYLDRGICGSNHGGQYDLCLQSRLDHVEWTGHRPGQTSRNGSRQELHVPPNVSTLLPSAGPALGLLVKHKLQGGERQVAVERGFVTVEKGREALLSDDRPHGIRHPPVVVPRGEVGVVESAL